VCAQRDHGVRERAATHRSELAADQALVRRAALTTEGKPLMPERAMAMTKGDLAAWRRSQRRHSITLE
jgi:hypothetical protein